MLFLWFGLNGFWCCVDFGVGLFLEVGWVVYLGRFAVLWLPWVLIGWVGLV